MTRLNLTTFSSEIVTNHTFKRGRKVSHYADLMDGQPRKIYVADWGHKSEQTLEAAFRAYARRNGFVGHAEKTGKGFVIVQTEKKRTRN